MPKVKVNDNTMNYEQQGAGEPLILIPYLAADDACYAFQVADYAKQFTCISIDPRGAGETGRPDGTYIRPNCSLTTSPASCRRSAWSGRM
jgi:3-oxoadipate enol-lactonase